MPRIYKSTEVESKLVVVSSWRKKRMGVTDDTHRASLQGGENVLELYSSNDWTLCEYTKNHLLVTFKKDEVYSM